MTRVRNHGHDGCLRWTITYTDAGATFHMNDMDGRVRAYRDLHSLPWQWCRGGHR